MSDRFHVKGTQSRPAGLPLFVLAHNNLNPLVEAGPDGLTIKVMKTNRLPWASITRVRNTTTLVGYALGVTSGGWEYLVHFREASERDRLRERLRSEGVELG